MTTFTVTNTNDSGDGSLRQAVDAANNQAGADTIVFSQALAGQTITLNTGNVVINSDVTIDGDVNNDDKADVAISGGGVNRVIYVLSGNATLQSLTITNGNGAGNVAGDTLALNGYGGAVANSTNGTLTVRDTTIQNSTCTDVGGAIYNVGTLTIIDSTLTGNTANFGGAIGQLDGSTTIINTTMTGNSAVYNGGVITAFNGSFVIQSSTLVGNSKGGDIGGIQIAGTASGSISNTVIAQNGGDVVGGTWVINNSVFGSNVAGVTSGTNGNLEKLYSSRPRHARRQWRNGQDHQHHHVNQRPRECRQKRPLTFWFS